MSARSIDHTTLASATSRKTTREEGAIRRIESSARRTTRMSAPITLSEVSIVRRVTGLVMRSIASAENVTASTVSV
ncbi:hypothetical protein [Microbacterium sp. NIBRBAC000506063]|uniref:hypothetical protein n=1 Tax=Microbacterium sp. NIBRBAC000506063 TaxID=2734618 RepID=UPI001CB6E2E9|nr:hypothetical protein [Microbacterium sp. NIBRBAC000506063]